MRGGGGGGEGWREEEVEVVEVEKNFVAVGGEGRNVWEEDGGGSVGWCVDWVGVWCVVCGVWCVVCGVWTVGVTDWVDRIAEDKDRHPGGTVFAGRKACDLRRG